MENENYGLIYGLTNPYFKGMVKIGATRSLDINKRMRVLGTAVPVPFDCAFAYKVPLADLFDVEHTLHMTFDGCRMPGSEFFEIDPKKVETLLRKLGKFEPMKAEVQEVINTEEAERKNPNMDFIKMGLHVGDTLVFRDNKALTCTIANNKKVAYDGQQYSLSKLTQQLRGMSYAVQPSPYWETEAGVPLIDLYNKYVREYVARTQENGNACAQHAASTAKAARAALDKLQPLTDTDHAK